MLLTLCDSAIALLTICSLNVLALSMQPLPIVSFLRLS